MRTLKITALLALPLLLLSGCLEPPPRPTQPTISFQQYQPFQLDVADIDVIEEYTSPMAPPYVEHTMPITPAEAMEVWVRDRIKAEGGSGMLQVIIKDASVTETPLQRTEGVKGIFTNDQVAQLNARLEVEMRIYGNEAMSLARINVVATRSDTLAENANPAARDKLSVRMVQALMALMNAELEKNFHQYFSNHILYTPLY